MRVAMHISEQICKLCQQDYLIELSGYGNNDENPVEQTGNGICIICNNKTTDFVGIHVRTSEPIEYLEEVKEMYRKTQEFHHERMNELISRYRKAKLAGETYISIVKEEKKDGE